MLITPPILSLGKSRGPQLPLARIKNIMKFDPEVNLIGNDSVYLIAKVISLRLCSYITSYVKWVWSGSSMYVRILASPHPIVSVGTCQL